MALGIARDHVTLSTLCTLCGEGLFSHRGGDRGRQVTLLGVQPEFP
jgi:hypothetical protein